MAKILIVDDSRTSRKILRGVLESAGYEIVGEASNGEEGFSMYTEFQPDLTTLDITMPVMDGLEALKKIKEFDSKAKVVMITAAGQQNKMVEAIKFGAAEFLTKPFDNEAIITLISRVLK